MGRAQTSVKIPLGLDFPLVVIWTPSIRLEAMGVRDISSGFSRSLRIYLNARKNFPPGPLFETIYDLSFP